MPQRQKNLLEAFQHANDERVGGDPVSAGPFADAPRSDPTTPPSPGVLPSFSLRDTRMVLVLLGWGLFAFTAGVVVGRMAGGESSEVRAEDGYDAGDAAPLSYSAASELSPGEEVNEALRDPANLYTIIAIQYQNSQAQTTLANATYFHFEELGLPVAHPLTYAGQILVLVGAARTHDELVALRDRVRATADPDGRPSEYADAYVVRIETILPRGG